MDADSAVGDGGDSPQGKTCCSQTTMTPLSSNLLDHSTSSAPSSQTPVDRSTSSHDATRVTRDENDDLGEQGDGTGTTPANDVNDNDEGDDDDFENIPEEFRIAPRMSPELERRERAALSDQELLAAHADVYGTLHPLERRFEEAVSAVEVELACIPTARKEAFLRAQGVFPFMFVATSHVKAVLEAEGYDPKRAARRMARYWEGRERLLGERAFDPDAFATPTDDDYRRLNGKEPVMSLDPDVDDDFCFLVCERLRMWSEAMAVTMDGELDMMPQRKKAAFLDARERDPDIAGLEKKLDCLRSVNFDPVRAARRMVNYWDMKYFIFGRERALDDPVTFESLEEDCREEIMAGFIYVLPHKDAFGRRIIVTRPGNMPVGRSQQKNLLRVVWYTLHTLFDDQYSSRNVVHIVFLTGLRIQQLSVDYMSRMNCLLLDCAPLKVKAIHNCGQPSLTVRRVIMPLASWLMQRNLRMRTVFHFGTEEEETLAELDECGIARDILPQFMGGGLDQEFFVEWLARQRRGAI